MKKTYRTPLSPLQQKRLWRFSLLLGVLFLLALFFLPERGLYFQRKQSQRVAAADAEREALVKKNEALWEEINRLKSDERYLEEVARQQHGLLKKDERVFEFSSRDQPKKEKQQ